MPECLRAPARSQEAGDALGGVAVVPLCLQMTDQAGFAHTSSVIMVHQQAHCLDSVRDADVPRPLLPRLLAVDAGSIEESNTTNLRVSSQSLLLQIYSKSHQTTQFFSSTTAAFAGTSVSIFIPFSSFFIISRHVSPRLHQSTTLSQVLSTFLRSSLPCCFHSSCCFQSSSS